MKLKLTNGTSFFAMLVCWLIALSPFYIPVANSIYPKIFGLPLTVFLTYLALILAFAVNVFSTYKIWDSFTPEDEDMER
jgi:uncharacterized membrane protein